MSIAWYDTLRNVHGLVRWLILLIGVLTVLKAAYSLASRAAYGRADRGLMAAYSGALDLQGLLGLILLIWGVLAPPPGLALPGLTTRVVHAVVQVAAIAIAHQSPRWRDAPDRLRHQAQLGLLVASLALVLVGVLIITR